MEFFFWRDAFATHCMLFGSKLFTGLLACLPAFFVRKGLLFIHYVRIFSFLLFLPLMLRNACNSSVMKHLYHTVSVYRSEMKMSKNKIEQYFYMAFIYSIHSLQFVDIFKLQAFFPQRIQTFFLPRYSVCCSMHYNANWQID